MIDEAQLTELEIHYENDKNLHSQSEMWFKNFLKRMKKGNYSHQLAIKGIKNNFVPKVIASYTREYVSPGPVDGETREALARRFIQYFEKEEVLGNLEYLKK